MSHWEYKGKKVTSAPEDMFGFVYLIVNKKTNRKYIGRKYLRSYRRKPLTKKQKEAGRKRRTKVVSESNWRVYMGSNEELLADIKEYGKENFDFIILAYGETKGQVNYIEENAHHKLNALTDPTYYNSSVGPRRYLGMNKDEQFHKKMEKLFD